ncbi:MAG: GDSL-type esterase/lipase family protein [Ferruginibacter sp.]
MLKLLTISFSIFYLFISCTKKENADINDNTTMTDTVTVSAKTWLALGDSYTIGQSVMESERYPVQTVAMLNSNAQLFAQPEIIAQTGWTTGDLLSRIASNPPKNVTYDIVTLLIGVNNQYQGLSESEYSNQFTILLNKAIAYAGNNKKHVIVLSIPDYSVTPFANGSDKAKIAREIDEFNAINKNISQTSAVNYLDITAYTRMAANDSTLVAYDGLHPSGKEYTKWSADLAVLIRSVL